MHRGEKTVDGPKASLSRVRFGHHNVKETQTKKETNKQEQGQQTNCPSQYTSSCLQARKLLQRELKSQKKENPVNVFVLN